MSTPPPYDPSKGAHYPGAPAPGGPGTDPYGQPTHPHAWGTPQPGVGGSSGPGAWQPNGHGTPDGDGRPPRRRGLLIGGAIGIILLVVALGFGIGILLDDPSDGQADPTSPAPVTADPTTDSTSESPAPTGEPTTTQPVDPQPTPTTEAEISDGRLTSAAFSFDAPEGWDLSADSGGRNEVQLVDADGSAITVYDMRTLSACELDVELLQIWIPGTIDALPDRSVGDLSATGNSLTGEEGEYYEMYCIEVGPTAYEITLNTIAARQDTAQPLFVTVLDSWEWAQR